MNEDRNYPNAKAKLLSDKSICQENRDLFKEFFEWEEHKLKRKNNLKELDSGCYSTLYGFTLKLRNTNKWFNNKPLKNITKKDIERVYDDLEDGKILTNKGLPFKDTRSYYSKVFKSKLFRMVGKDELAKEVIEFSKKKDEDVRYIEEITFRKLVKVIKKPIHELLCWLAFDIGENITSLLQLKKSDCYRQKNKETKETEYRINLRAETLKRTRTARAEITNYQETADLLDIILRGLKEGDLVFPFGYGWAKKFLYRAVQITDTKCIPKGQPLTWKDLRSSMACDLLSKDWHTDEINTRLGHRPSSEQIDKYVNFLAIGKHKTKKKVTDHNLEQLKEELEDSKRREKLNSKRIESLIEDRVTDKELFEKEIKAIKLKEGSDSGRLIQKIIDRIKNEKGFIKSLLEADVRFRKQAKINVRNRQINKMGGKNE